MRDATLGRDRDAMEAWARAVELDPRQYDALYNLGVAFGRAGDLQAARQHLDRFVRTAPAAAFPRELAEARRLLKETGAL